jgi:hypothetical protein
VAATKNSKRPANIRGGPSSAHFSILRKHRILRMNPIPRSLRGFHTNLVYPLLIGLTGNRRICLLLDRFMCRSCASFSRIQSLCDISPLHMTDDHTSPRGAHKLEQTPHHAKRTSITPCRSSFTSTFACPSCTFTGNSFRASSVAAFCNTINCCALGCAGLPIFNHAA